MITPGLILIAEGTALPKSVVLGNEIYPLGWTSTESSDNKQLQKQLSVGGWIFYYLAGAIKMSGYGLDRQKSVRAALGRIISRTKSQGCNCVEIDEVATHSFFGFPYITMSAHARHIEKVPPVQLESIAHNADPQPQPRAASLPLATL